MRLTDEQERILDGKDGKILQRAMTILVKYGTAMGAEEFIPVTSAHTLFKSLKFVAEIFSPSRTELTDKEIAEFGKLLATTEVRARTTINPLFTDLDKWREMGVDVSTYKWVKEGVKVAERCGMLPTCSCTPYLMYNIPHKGEHCSWSESSTFPYCNGILGARVNRDGCEVSLASSLLGITPKFGMHLDKNRRGTHLIEVQCQIDNLSDWGALGYFAGEITGLGVPVFKGLRRPSVEEAKQLCAGINTSGGVAMLHISGVTPEAPTVEDAFGNSIPKEAYIFDESARQSVYERLNFESDGKVDMVFIGCPLCTLAEVRNIARLVEGRQVAKGTKFWIATDYATKFMAKWLGYARIIEGSGGILLAGACLISCGSLTCRAERMATNSAKQAYYCAAELGSRVLFSDTTRCVDVAIRGGA